MPSRKLLALGLLAWGAYLGLRSLLQALLPAHDLFSYLRQDSAITVLRALSALAFFLLIRHRWKNSASGLAGWALPGAWGWAAAAALLAGGLVGCLAQAMDAGAPWWARGLELGIALVVAANEELAFRGLFYNAAREIWGRKAAVWGTSVAFSLSHLGYQPAFHAPQLLAIGLCFAWLRDRGTGLPALIALHFAYDAMVALMLPRPPLDLDLYELSLLLSAAAAWMAWKAGELPAGEDLARLFAYGTLRRGQGAARALNMEGRAQWCGAARAAGAKVVEADGYPGLLWARGKGAVPGELWALRDPGLLKDLDDYEGENYLRDSAEIGGREAWVYALRPRTSRRRRG